MSASYETDSATSPVGPSQLITPRVHEPHASTPRRSRSPTSSGSAFSNNCYMDCVILGRVCIAGPLEIDWTAILIRRLRPARSPTRSRGPAGRSVASFGRGPPCCGTRRRTGRVRGVPARPEGRPDRPPSVPWADPPPAARCRSTSSQCTGAREGARTRGSQDARRL
jgi:hypothetical protein